VGNNELQVLEARTKSLGIWPGLGFLVSLEVNDCEDGNMRLGDYEQIVTKVSIIKHKYNLGPIRQV